MLDDTAVILFVRLPFQNKSLAHNSCYNWITCFLVSHDKLFYEAAVRHSIAFVVCASAFLSLRESRFLVCGQRHQ